jgi:signal transduction histidine kinase
VAPRGARSSAGIVGTGLGLSLVKRLTVLHEGTVTLTLTLGAGSEFTVRIPGLAGAAGA